MKNRSYLFLGTTVPVITIFLSIFLITGVFCKNSNSTFGSTGDSPLRSDSAVADVVKSQEVFRKIYDMNKNSVVFISTEQTVKLQRNPFLDDPFFRQFFGPDRNQQQPRTQKRTGLGTGFIISEDGYVCTNFHVVNGVDSVKVKVDSESYDAKIIGSDERTDLALLKLDSKKKFTPVYFGDSDKVNVGDWAIAIGNPFGLDKTFTVGIISAAARRDLDLMGGSQTHIQTDASINPGNSGGPLLNIYGEVIGINRMIYSRSGGNIGIGFAIPVNTAKSVLEQLKTHKKIKRGYIGVQIVPLSEEYAKELGLKNTDGALVGGVAEDSPAKKGGVMPGDVIIAADDKEVKNFGDLLSKVEGTPIGKTLKIQVWRNRSKLNLYITVKERP
ncbi:MAG TPA: trypsin-like peptidase domain-containing protein [Spirochaetota bacterium]|nr:trypsin-like peptidase domain-containing protein [Spirochaetota bacterium]